MAAEEETGGGYSLVCVCVLQMSYVTGRWNVAWTKYDCGGRTLSTEQSAATTEEGGERQHGESKTRTRSRRMATIAALPV